MTIQNARSNVSGRVPASLQDGQIAINQADGVLFSRNPDGTIKRNLLAKRTGVADAAFSARSFDTYIGIASLTASRAIALPAASAYPPGSPLTIADESGAVSPTVTLTITAAGTDKINGASTLAMATAFGGTLLYSDGVSKWTAIALPAGAASNSVLFVPQSMTAGQQDQARSNVSGAVAALPSATMTLAALDFDRDQFVTGTSTITMPSAVAPGWRSGIVANTNAVTGLVTLAVPSGHILDGVTNGSTTLFPFQRARLVIVAAGIWRTVWIDRSPIVAQVPFGSAVASWDFNLPVGYGRFRFAISRILPGSAGGLIILRLSADGGATIKAGSTDYSYSYISSNGNSVVSANSTSSYMFVTTAVLNDATGRGIAQVLLDLGANGERQQMMSTTSSIDTTPALQTVVYSGICSALTSSRPNFARFLWLNGSGTGSAAFTVYGEP